MLYTTYFKLTCSPVYSQWKPWGNGEDSLSPSYGLRALSSGPCLRPLSGEALPPSLPSPSSRTVDLNQRRFCHLGTSGNVWRRFQLGVGCCCYLQCIRQSPQQNIIWSKEAAIFRNLKASYKWIWTTTNICGVTFEILKEHEYLNLQWTQYMSCRLVTVHVLGPLLQCKLWRRGSRYSLLNPQA